MKILIALLLLFVQAEFKQRENVFLYVEYSESPPDSVIFYADGKIFQQAYWNGDDFDIYMASPQGGVYYVSADVHFADWVYNVEPIHMTYTPSADTLGRTFTTQVPYPVKVILEEPEHNATDVSIDVLLRWSPVMYADYYQLQVTKDVYSNAFIDVNVYDTEYQLSNLEYLTTYHWRVRAWNETGAGEWSGE